MWEVHYSNVPAIFFPWQSTNHIFKVAVLTFTGHKAQTALVIVVATAVSKVTLLPVNLLADGPFTILATTAMWVVYNSSCSVSSNHTSCQAFWGKILTCKKGSCHSVRAWAPPPPIDIFWALFCCCYFLLLTPLRQTCVLPLHSVRLAFATGSGQKGTEPVHGS